MSRKRFRSFWIYIFLTSICGMTSGVQLRPSELHANRPVTTLPVVHTGIEVIETPGTQVYDIEIIRSYHILRPTPPYGNGPTAGGSFRSKRGFNWQRLNPLSYVGWAGSRMFGLVHSFDIEDLKVSSERLSRTVGQINDRVSMTLKKITGIENIISIQEVMIQDLNNEIQSSISQFRGVTSSLREELHEWVHNLINVIQYQGEQLTYQDLESSCLTNSISTLVLADLIASDKKNIKEQLTPDFEMKWGLAELFQYDEYKAIKCHHLGDSLVLSIVIPLITRDTRLRKTFDLIPLPMKKGPMTCVTSLPRISVSILNDGIEVLVTSQFCSSDMCLMKTAFQTSGIFSSCIKALINGDQVNELYLKCGLNCSRTNQEVWTHLGNRRIHISCPSTATLTCQVGRERFSHLITVDESVIVQVPSHCILHSDVTIILGQKPWAIVQKPVIFPLKPLFSTPHIGIHVRPLSDNLTQLFAKTIHQNLVYVNHTLQEIDSIQDINITSIPTIEWNSPYSTGLALIVVIVVLCGFCLLCCCSKRQGIRGGLAGWIPCVSAYNVEIGMETADTLLLTIVFLVLLSILLWLRKIYIRMQCHEYIVKGLNLAHGPHLDLKISIDGKLRSLKILDLFPNEAPASDLYRQRIIEIMKTGNEVVCVFPNDVDISLSTGRLVTLSKTLVLPYKAKEGSHRAWFTFQTY